MVQKYHSPIRVYKYPFELVMAAYERRFPSCDMIPVFEGSEIISEEKSEDGAEIIIVRRCKLNVDAPYLLKKIAGVDYFYCLQKNILDYRSRTLKIQAWNESFSNRIIIEEYCTYFVHPENQDWTCFEQSASLEVKSFFGFENAVEKLSAKHYAASIKKGKEVIEHFIEELKKEGISFIEPFKDKEPLESNGKLENELEDGDKDKENENLVNKQELSANNKSPNTKLQNNDTSIDEKIPNSLDKQLSVDEKSKDNKISKEEKKKLSPNKVNNISTTTLSSNQTTTQLTAQQKRDLMKKQQTSFSTFSTFPSTNANSKLEADYIQKCIGEMSPYQESCLVQLKKLIIETHYNQGNQPTQTNMSLKKKIPSDQTLMRFLKANDYNLEKAREMLCSSLVWRKGYNLPEVVQKYYPGCWLNNHDKDGRPIYMLMVGLLDLKGFVRSIGQEGLVKLTLHICEQGLKKAEEATKKFGKPISTWTLLLDLEGLNMRHLWRPGIKVVLHIIEMVEANYPETLGRVIMTRAPRIFPVLFTILATFINENTSKKFVFLGDQQDLKILEQFIDKKDIPKFLGGKLDNPPQLLIGGLIPKSHYVNEEKANELNMLDNTMYTNISLTKPGQTHEVLYDIKDSQSVICWDFNILKQNVIFNFYRLNSNLQQHQIVNKVNSDTNFVKEEKSHSKDNLNNNNLVKKLSKENVNDDKKKQQQAASSQESINDEQLTTAEKHLQNRLSGDASCGLIIPKNWQLNKDFQQIEPELLCREGESIQNSYITSKPGKYVLQWKYVESDANHHHSFTSHKAKIMYYIEVIKSKTFKGSMTSLSSLHSSHSTNSGTTNNQLINQKTTNGSCVV